MENEPSGTPVQQLEELEDSISKLPYGCTVDMSGDDSLAFELKFSAWVADHSKVTLG